MTGPELETRDAGGMNFKTTHWNVVSEARDGSTTGAHEALGQLCQTYWPPVYLHLRRRGHDRPEAEDLTQQFFAELLGRNFLESVERGKGRFRSFLLACLKNFLNNQWHRQRTLRRGGGFQILQLDEAIAELEAGAGQWGGTDDAVFDRDWALHVLQRALRLLEDEHAAAGRGEFFQALRPMLTADEAAGHYGLLAARLGTTPGALKVAVHRLRARFRRLLLAEVANTVAVPGDLADEMRHLLSALRTVPAQSL